MDIISLILLGKEPMASSTWPQKDPKKINMQSKSLIKMNSLVKEDLSVILKAVSRSLSFQALNINPGNKPKSALEKVEREISILKQLNHPNVIKLVEEFDDASTNQKYLGNFSWCIDSHFPHLVMEYAHGGPILEWDEINEKFFPPKYKGYLCEDTLRVLFNQIIDGVEYSKFFLLKRVPLTIFSTFTRNNTW